MVCNRNLLFQGSIFGFFVSFREGTSGVLFRTWTGHLMSLHRAPMNLYIHVGCLYNGCKESTSHLSEGAQGSISKVAHHLSHRRDSWWWCSVSQMVFFIFSDWSSTWGACWWTFPKILYRKICEVVKYEQDAHNTSRFLWFFLPLKNLAFRLGFNTWFVIAISLQSRLTTLYQRT